MSRIASVTIQSSELGIAYILLDRPCVQPIFITFIYLKLHIKITMLRFIPLFTLIPTVFIFVSVMVINIGGVYTENQSTLYEKNPTFNLVNVKFCPLSYYINLHILVELHRHRGPTV